MNLADLMLRGVSSTFRTLIPYGSIIATCILAWGAVRSCNRAIASRAEIISLKERGALAEKGLQAAQRDSKALKDRLSAELQASAVLRTALADTERRVKEATGKAPKVIEVVRWRTAPGQAGGEAPAGRTSLVERGDTLAIRGTSIKLETRAGNHLVTGTAQCLRLKPPPETVLYEGPFDLGEVTVMEPSPEPLPSSRPWSAGVVGAIDTGGKWGVGPSVGYDFWRLRATLGMTFPDQRTVGSVLVRW